MTDETVEALQRAWQAAQAQPPGSEERRALAARIASAQPHVLTWMALAFEEFSGYRFDRGHAALDAASRADPRFLAAHWLRMQFPDDPAPASEAAAARYCERWERGLALFERLDWRDPALAAQVWGCIGSAPAFYRHYLGPCHAEQARYGALLARMMAALAPGIAPRPLRRGRRTIAFCSPYFREHTVARLFVPLLERLPRDAFELHCVQFDAAHADPAWDARLAAIGTLHRGPRTAPQWRELLAGLQADVLVHLDVGMHPLTQGLAALRLAPVQACLWGHPVTTGLPTIDWFLSPDAIEPAGADAHYTERLLRLPGFGHGLEAPDDEVQAGAADARDLLCAQSVYKLLPMQDALFGRILAATPDARLHLIPHPEPHVRDWLAARMRPALLAAGADPDRQLVLHGYRPLAEFRRLAAGCALNLDSIGWSGGMSSLDVLALGVPTVTLPGTTMRSRQTAALLEALDAHDGIACDADDYVERAIAFARSSERRAATVDALRRNRARLYAAQPVADALAQFLATVEPSA